MGFFWGGIGEVIVQCWPQRPPFYFWCF